MKREYEMQISGFTIQNKREFADGSKQFDLLYQNALIAHVTADDMFEDVAFDFVSHRQTAAGAGKKLLQRYPDGIDSSFRYGDLGSIGLTSAAAYAGEYGNIVFLLEQLVRMDELEELYNQSNGEHTVVVYKTKHSPLTTKLIPHHSVEKFQHDVVFHNGVITFIGGKPTDFTIKD